MWERTKPRGHTPGAQATDRGRALLQTTRAFLDDNGIEREVTLDSPLAEPGLGLDSIQRMSLLATIEKQCELKIPEALWAETRTTTLRQLVAQLIWR